MLWEKLNIVVLFCFVIMPAGERVLLKHLPDDKVIFPWIIGKGGVLIVGLFVMIFVFTGFARFTLASTGLFNILLILLFVGAIALMVYYDVLRKTFEYTVTNQGVHFKGGIFWKFDKFVSYHKVTNISSEQSIIEQLVKLGHINIHTAGQLTGARGMAVPEITIEGLPIEKSKKVLELLRNKISK
jgi:uncharacterized membrane protein YdbT with pleckstrin-like domain